MYLNITIVNSFKHYIKEYFLKKLGDVEAGNYSYTKIVTKLDIVSPFSPFQYQNSFQCFQSFPCMIYFN